MLGIEEETVATGFGINQFVSQADMQVFFES